MIEEGGTRLLEVQIKIGDIKSNLTELATKMSAGTTSLEGLKKVRENSLQQLEAIKNEIAENRKEIRRLKRDRDRLSKEIVIKQSQYAVISNEAAELRSNLGENSKELRSNLGENSKKIRGVEGQLDKLTRDLINLRSDYVRSQTAIKVFSRRISDLKTRRDRFASTLNDLKKSYADLKVVQREQTKRSKNLERTLERRIAQRESRENRCIRSRSSGGVCHST
jgi:chromosome segregation ATPase